MSWCFATVNGKLAEIFFERQKEKLNILGHAYVKKSEYKTKKEKTWIENDARKFVLIYRNNAYEDLTNGDKYLSSKSARNSRKTII